MNEISHFNRKTKQRAVTHHLGLVPHVLLAVSHSSAQRRRLYILTPVGGATSTLLSAEQRGRYGCKVDQESNVILFRDSLQRSTRQNQIHGYVITA